MRGYSVRPSITCLTDYWNFKPTSTGMIETEGINSGTSSGIPSKRKSLDGPDKNAQLEDAIGYFTNREWFLVLLSYLQRGSLY